MTDLPVLHVFTTLHERHGGVLSVRELASRLRSHFQVRLWSVVGEIHPDNVTAVRHCADSIGELANTPPLAAGEHALLYLNDYPVIFANFRDRWQRILGAATSVQLVFNRALGSMPDQAWLADVITRIYFHDSDMRESWRWFTRGSPLSDIPSEVLAPPADLTGFLELSPERNGTVVVGRLAGDASVPRNAVALYQAMADALPDAQYWFMPGPPMLRAGFAGDSRFRFFDPFEIDARDFLSACHIYALTYWSGSPVPGPRSLMEAMAAGCAPVVIDREGPRDRVIHGVSGFRSNDPSAFIAHVVRLGRDPALRDRIARAARERAASWDPDDWIRRIVGYSLSAPHGYSEPTA